MKVVGGSNKASQAEEIAQAVYSSAKKGDLKELAFISIHRSGETSMGFSLPSTTGKLLQMIGQLEHLKLMMVEELALLQEESPCG